MDGVISEKEREVVFRKSKELGVPEDECEIILNGMMYKMGSTKKVETNLLQSENYIDQSNLKIWFDNWLENDKLINETINNLNHLLGKSLIEFLDSDEDRNSRIHPIQKETLLELCDLNTIESIPSSFFKSGVEGKKGFVESTYKTEIYKILEEEKFISCISSSVSNEFSIKVNLPWKDEDVKQMIENYHYPNRDLGGGWYKLVYKLNSRFLGRDTILITDKSIIEIHHKPNSFSRTTFEDLNVKTFLDEFDNFKQSFNEIKGFLKSKYLKINHLSPRNILHDNTLFNSVIEKIGINEQTRRIINIDIKVKEFLDENYNNQIGKLSNQDLFVYNFKEEKTPGGLQKIVLRENSILGTLNTTSLQFFEFYLKLLKFRDDVLNLYLSNKIIDLEMVLSSFENSELNLSKFQKESLSKLESISQNLIELKIITTEGFEKISDDSREILNRLESTNEYNKEILSSLNFNNFLNVVSTYQLYKINKNTKPMK
jgi:hypothetical protein